MLNSEKLNKLPPLKIIKSGEWKYRYQDEHGEIQFLKRRIDLYNDGTIWYEIFDTKYPESDAIEEIPQWLWSKFFEKRKPTIKNPHKTEDGKICIICEGHFKLPEGVAKGLCPLRNETYLPKEINREKFICPECAVLLMKKLIPHFENAFYSQYEWINCTSCKAYDDCSKKFETMYKIELGHKCVDYEKRS